MIEYEMVEQPKGHLGFLALLNSWGKDGWQYSGSDYGMMIFSRQIEETDLSFDFVAHIQRQKEFSERTFGPGPRVEAILDHFRKELVEVESDPTDLEEWIDVMMLAIDGAWRSGASPDKIVSALVLKQIKNEGRKWPDWRSAAPGKAIEHDRSGESK